MRSFRLMALLAMCLMLLAAPVQAKTTITFWHGMGGELGEITDEMIKESVSYTHLTLPTICSV